MKDFTAMWRASSVKGRLAGNRKVTWGAAILLAVLLCLSVAALFLFSPLSMKGGTVWIYEGGHLLGYYPLNVDRTLRARGPLGITVIRIHHGEAAIISAPCPHKFCEKMGPIPRHGSVMICIPNRIVVEVKGKKGLDTDAVTR